MDHTPHARKHKLWTACANGVMVNVRTVARCSTRQREVVCARSASPLARRPRLTELPGPTARHDRERKVAIYQAILWGRIR